MDSLRARFEAFVMRLWFGPMTPRDRALAASLRPLLAPLSSIASRIGRNRRARIAGRIGKAESADQLPPIVVVGNLVAGGSGKTPIVAALARALNAGGWRVGIITRSYRADARRAQRVSADSDARSAGDEAVLLARETGLPVASAPRRADALQALPLAELDVILSDDGAQHEALPRAIELLVLDSRGLGNGRCIPAGPLREPADALTRVDAVILNEDAHGRIATLPEDLAAHVAVAGVPMFRSRLEPRDFLGLGDGGGSCSLQAMRERVAGAPVLAVAGIARPERFFATLASLGIDALRMPLQDHGSVEPAVLQAVLDDGRASLILMTSKDAQKLRDAPPSLRDRCFELRMAAEPDSLLLHWLVQRLQRCRNGRETARDTRLPPVQGATAP